MSAPGWRLEWALALRRRRLLLLNVGIPLLLVAPVALGGAPAFHAAAVFAVLFVLFGTFGSAIPLVRDGQSGLLRRLLLAGVPPGGLLLQRLTAAAAIDLLQLLPSMALILWAGGAGASAWALAPPVLFATLVVANLLGAWVAAGARSLAEGALFAAVVSLFLLHASGVFRTPAPGTPGAMVEALAPYRSLHSLLLGAAEGTRAGATFEGLPALAGGTALLLGLSALAARRLLERISTTGRD